MGLLFVTIAYYYNERNYCFRNLPEQATTVVHIKEKDASVTVSLLYSLACIHKLSHILTLVFFTDDILTLVFTDNILALVSLTVTLYSAPSGRLEVSSDVNNQRYYFCVNS